MAKYLRPRRGKYADANSQNITLKRGEMFLCLSNNDDIGQGPGALYIGDGASSFSEFSHDGSTVANTAQPILVHPMIYKPIFEDSNPSTSSWTIDAGTSEIDDIGDGTADVTLPEIIGSVKGALVKHADSIKALDEDKASKTYVDNAIDNLPEPMIYKGTLGVNGTITDLPNASTANEGYTYKVITDGTYAGQVAKVGDVFTSNATSWIIFSGGDSDTDTWRPVKVNGTEELGSGISSGSVDFVNGNNTTVVFDSNNNTISINTNGTTYADFTGATTATAGAHGLVPAPTVNDVDKFLKADGSWANGGRPMVILSYGNSTWNDFITAYKNNVIVYCRASSGENPAVGAQGRMAFMAYLDSGANPTYVEFQYYRSEQAHTIDQQGDQVFVYKLHKTNGWSVINRQATTKIVAGANMTSSYSDGVLTLNSTGGGSGDNDKVTQTEDTSNAEYEVLLSNNASTATETDGVKKSEGMKYNPSNGNVTISGTLTDKNGLQTIKRISDADYQSLSEAEKNNGTIYHRYDASELAEMDVKVTQTESTNNLDYEVLLSNNASTATENDGVNKSAGFKYNPSTGNVTIGGMLTDVNGLQTIRRVTNAEYQNLSYAEKNNGVIYHITDIDGAGGLPIDDFIGATTASAGAHGLVPAPAISDIDKFLKGDGTWGVVSTSDINVTQTESATNADYEVLLSNNASTALETGSVKKSSGLKFNPSTGKVSTTMVSVSGTPTNNTDVATKQYVDNLINASITEVLADTY